MSDEVPIRYAPNLAPAYLRTERTNGDAIKAKWAVPVDATWESNNRRWGHIDIYIYCNASRDMANSGWVESRDKGRYVTGDRIWVRDLGIASEHEQPFDRVWYHPQNAGRYLNDMSWDVFAENGKGAIHSYSTFTFQPPKPPEFEEPTMSEGIVSAVMKTPEGKDEYDRYDTRYRVVRQDNFNSAYVFESPLPNCDWKTTTETSFTVESSDVSDATALLPGQWVKITFEAYARGVKGDSTTVRKTYVFSYPPVASIRDIKVSGLSSSDIVTVLLNTNQTGNTPVDKVKLQRIITPAPTVADVEAPGVQGWTDVEGAEDNGNCQGLVDTVGNALPPRNQYTYYRLVTERANVTRVGNAVKATALQRKGTPSSDDTITISSVTSGEDGTSLILKLAWKNDDSTGTEVSWAENEDAWESNEQPTTYDVTWEDMSGGSPDPQVQGFDHSATLVIRGMETGKKYYIKARRFLDDGNDKTFSDVYGTPADGSYPIAPYVLPKNVLLDLPVYSKKGEDLEVVWTFEGDTVPTGWILYRILANDTKVVVDSGDDAYQATTIKSEVLDDMLESIAYSDNKITFMVSMTVGSGWVNSPAASVTIQDPPAFTLATNGVLLAQPMQFVARSNESNPYISYKVVAKGISTQLPDKMVNQVEGDVVYSEKITPIWYPSGDDFYATVTLPEALEFYDGGSYRIEASAVSSVTGLVSDIRTYDFEVNWLHQAHRPGYDTEIVPDLETLSVTIKPDYPDNYVETDLLDIYRLSPEGSVKIAESLHYGCEVIDRLAPFTKRTESAYRLVTRTTDGDLQWTDVEYKLDGYQMRFDWKDDKSLELPYDVEIKNAFNKDFESRAHIDGSIIGYWNDAVSRSGTLKSKLLRLSDPDRMAMAIELARYPGPVFVRLPDGSAFTANVTVSGIDDNFNTMVDAISIKADEIAIVDEYKVRPGDVSYPGGYTPPTPTEYHRKQILDWSETIPTSGANYALNETPVGDVVVKLTSSYDYYANPWTIPATVIGRAVTIGTLSQDVEDYISGCPQGTQFLIQAYYNI